VENDDPISSITNAGWMPVCVRKFMVGFALLSYVRVLRIIVEVHNLKVEVK
jgi:hypothetical protein